MQSVYAKVDGCTLTCLDYFVVKLLLYLSHNFLDTCRMNTSVGYKLMQSQATNLTTYRVEGWYYDSLRGVVHYDFHTGGSLKSADVTSLTANDTTLYFVVVNVEYAHWILNCSLSSHTLDCLYDDFLSLCIGVELCLVHNLVDVACGIGTGFILQTLYKTVLGFLCAQPREFLKLLTLLGLHLVKLLLLDSQKFLLIVNALLALLNLLLTASKFLLSLIERNLTLLQTVLVLLNLLVALLHLLFKFRLLVEELLLYLQELFLFQNFSLLSSGCYHFIIFSLYIAENSIACGNHYDECH